MDNRKYLIIIMGVVVLLTIVIGVVAFALFIMFGNNDKVQVTIKVSPSDSIVYVDNIESKSGTIFLKTGKHVFTAKRQYFSDYSVTKTIDSKSTDNTIILLPEPISEAAYTYLKDNPDVQQEREGLGGEEANTEGESLRETNPIIKILPVIESDYRIDYGRSQKYPDNKTAIMVIITSTSESSKQDALEYLTSKNLDTSKLEITYKTFD